LRKVTGARGVNRPVKKKEEVARGKKAREARGGYYNKRQLENQQGGKRHYEKPRGDRERETRAGSSGR